jgi:hypothetical protein
VFDGAKRGAVADARAASLVLGLQVAVVGADRGHGGVLERLVEPFAGVAGAAGAALAKDSWLPRQRPAQEARCPADAKRVMSTPISPMMVRAVRVLMPSIERSGSSRSRPDRRGILSQMPLVLSPGTWAANPCRAFGTDPSEKPVHVRLLVPS